MKANNSIENVSKFISNPGQRYKITYRPVVRKDGDVDLVPDGKIDVQQQIDSWAEQTDFSYILRQMAAGMYVGRTDGQYGDFTKIPDNMAGVLQLKIDAEREFYNLPLDIRKKFDGDPMKWLVQLNMNTEDAMRKMELIKDPENIEVEKDVKE